MRRLLLLALCAPIVLLPGNAQDKKKPPKTEPAILLCIPLGAAPGKATKLTLRGANLDTASSVKLVDVPGAVKIITKGKAAVPDKNPDKVGDTQVEIELMLDAKVLADAVAVVVVTPTGETKPHLILVDARSPVSAEKESNDSFRMAQSITLPAMIDGTIGRPKDVDVYRFEGKKGQRVSAETLASRHGSPLDAILTLYDSKGQQLAANDDFAKEHRDARIELQLPSDGEYYLSLIDAHDAGSNLYVYRLVIK